MGKISNAGFRFWFMVAVAAIWTIAEIASFDVQCWMFNAHFALTHITISTFPVTQHKILQPWNFYRNITKYTNFIHTHYLERLHFFFVCVCVYLSLCEFIMLKCESCIVSVTCISNIYAPIIHKQQYYNESISKTYFLLLIHQQFFRQLKNANWTDSFRCVLVNKIIALGFQEYLITRISSSASFKFNAYSQLIVNETGFFFCCCWKIHSNRFGSYIRYPNNHCSAKMPD